MEFDVGARLKEHRLQAGLTQQQLGERVGVSKSVISSYELRERIPSPEVLVKLAAIFHVFADYLLGIEEGCSIDITGLDTEVVIHLFEKMLYTSLFLCDVGSTPFE